MENNKETKVCKSCGREMPISSFMLTRFGTASNVCKDCIREKKLKKIDARKDRNRIAKLEDYTVRELCDELKNRGIYWDNMYVLKKEYIDYNKI